MGTYTPGPWEWKPSGAEANHFMVVKPKGGFNGDAIIAHLRCEENARLIAAAPAMLSVLRAAEAYLNEVFAEDGRTNYSDTKLLRLQVREVIAKAEGA